ncbi:MAG: PAS domain S-box protein [Sphingobacteriales bacterium]|nr:MAG: PAS domain S-box protein [Sphingobacteriales bacterium]
MSQIGPGQESALENEATLQQSIYSLKESIRLAEMMNDASIDRILAVDRNLQIIAWNKTCEVFSGIVKDDAIGKYFFDIFPHLSRRPEIVEAIDNALKGFKTFVPANKDFIETEYSEHHFIPLQSPNGEVIGVLNIVHDVAHRVKTENELKALNKALVKKNRELKLRNSELLSFSQVTGHDLKEPLRKIYLFIEMLMGTEYEKLSEKGKTHFRRVQGAVQRMGLLTDDILAFSQLHNDDRAITVVNLNEVLADVTAQLRQMIDLKSATITAGDLPKIKGNQGMLVQLFKNILVNALKFHKDDIQHAIRISASVVASGDMKHADVLPDTNYWKLSFEDNGIGFDNKYAGQVFKMFKRLHKNEEYSGTGIGLAICKKICELHFGFITAEGMPAEGAVFNCYLPANYKS